MTSSQGYATVGYYCNIKEGFIMLEMAKLLNAKDYMDKLSNGIDPVGDEVLTKETLLDNLDLSRCFFFVSDVLRQVIENGGVIRRKSRNTANLPPFDLSGDLRDQIEVTEAPAMIRHFTDRINSLVDLNCMRKLKVTALTGWLVKNGFLSEEVINDKKRKIPTKAGEKLGIYSEGREGRHGNYLATLYKESAQRHIIENLDQIIILSNGE